LDFWDPKDYTDRVFREEEAEIMVSKQLVVNGFLLSSREVRALNVRQV